MKLKTVSLVLLSLILGIGCNQPNENQPQSNSGGVPKQAKQNKINHQSKPSASPFGSGGDAFFKNLQVYFINGESDEKDAKYLPLAEAMEKGIARVNETGRVNNLTIENLSETEYVFVNAGDIVKGGRQDRYLANSMIVPPDSGKVPLASFCVEKGRWSPRGRESAEIFSGSNFSAPSINLRVAAQLDGSQEKVWKEVAQAQALYAFKIGPSVQSSAQGAASNPPLVYLNDTDATTAAVRVTPAMSLGPPRPTPMRPTQSQPSAITVSFRTPGSSTSLQLALENPKILELVKEYTDNMDRQLAAQKNPVGFAVAINGKVVSADIYGQADLFKALWPKLINGAATEAVAEFDEKLEVERLKQADFEAFLINEKQGSPVKRILNDQTQLLTTKGNRHILFETHDKRNSSKWIHRSYLANPKK